MVTEDAKETTVTKDTKETIVTEDGQAPEEPWADNGPREPTVTLQRWRRFVDTPPASFTLLPEHQWLQLGGASREAYGDARISYHSEMIVVATSLVRDVARQGRLLTLLNRQETGARRMMILSGPQTTGKTTALKQLGRLHELRLRARQPGRAGDRIPVVYVSTPPKGSPASSPPSSPVSSGSRRLSGSTTQPTSPTPSARS
ncbi:TniB family NTP-binding protein [Trebonia kvetii]|uniref:TniB family NTP-binding protein n=1 Tax=Trebonia kvetii TaxID=2480626 RepID=UPI001C9E7428|nr:TniB family NTP-binding protein [Trebonia kvetii]